MGGWCVCAQVLEELIECGAEEVASFAVQGEQFLGVGGDFVFDGQVFGEAVPAEVFGRSIRKQSLGVWDGLRGRRGCWRKLFSIFERERL